MLFISYFFDDSVSVRFRLDAGTRRAPRVFFPSRARDLCGSQYNPRRDPPPVGGRMAATLESLALLRAVRQLDAEGGLSDMELEEVRASLKGGREVLANLLAYPPRKAEDRAAVRG